MKKIFFIVFALLLCANLTYATDTDWDCAQVLTKDRYLSNRDETNENLSKAMPKEAMEKAFDNLKSYCCDTNKLGKTSCDTTSSNALYPESIYLVDHILDVYLRRLDAKQENENWSDLLYGLEPDWSGKERREFISKRGNEVNWSLPLEIQKKYEIAWTTTQSVESYSDYIGANKNIWTSKVSGAITVYDTWTLYDKYYLACDVSNYIVITKNFGTSLTPQEYQSCKQLTYNRIDNEKLYVQTLLMQKWEKLLWSNMNAYLGTYFVKSKLSNLLKTIFDMSTSFSEINKAISKLTPECS